MPRSIRQEQPRHEISGLQKSLPDDKSPKKGPFVTAIYSVREIATNDRDPPGS